MDYKKKNKLSRIKSSTLNNIFEYLGTYESFFLAKLCRYVRNCLEKFLLFKKTLNYITNHQENNEYLIINLIRECDFFEKEVSYFLNFIEKQLKINPDDLAIEMNDIINFKGKEKTPLFTKEICNNLLKNYDFVREKKRSEEEIILMFAFITLIMKKSKNFQNIRKEVLVPITLLKKLNPSTNHYSDLKEKVCFFKFNENYNFILSNAMDLMLFIGNYQGIKVKNFIYSELQMFLSKSIIYNENIRFLILQHTNSEKNMLNLLSLLNSKENTIKSKIKYLDLSFNYLSTNAACVLGNYIGNNRFIEYLIIGSNDFNDQAMSILAESLIRNKSIKLLDLSNNQISSEGIKHISEALMINQNLQFLYLNSNPIDYKAIKFLSFCLKFNNTIELLYICSCQLDDSSAIYLRSLLTRNKALKIIDLSGNFLGNFSLRNILEGIKVNNHIQLINLEQNKCDDSNILDENIEMLVRKNNLITINLKDNNFKVSKINFDLNKYKKIVII